MNRKVILIASAAGILALAGTGCTKLRARDHLNKGVQAYRNAQYPNAVEHFKQAVELDPAFPTARLYLATAYMMQYIPGAESPENMKMAQAAHDQFLKVLEQNPKDDVAIASIASLFLNQTKWEEAAQWYKKLIEVNPNNKEAYYSLGFIAWKTWYVPYATARAELGMKQEDPGPIKDKKIRENLKAKYWTIIEEGMANLQKALDIDPQYDDAMAYLNLLHRERADLMDTPAEYRKEIDVADNWVQKALETKKLKAEGTVGAAGQAQ
ncbi:MAG: tetratricopeptide repeat protein [Bryobacterales bacterium]|nr:tetratricopeptide repeat protein [Bryobacterales bacterium]